MQMRTSPNILAVLYTDGLAADRRLAEWGYSLRSLGLAVAGIVQLNTFARDPGKCDMAVEELFSGTVLQLSEDRGPEARGCRLDRSSLAEAGALLLSALEEKPDILIVNKFGKVEAEGGGLRDALAKAVELDVPIIVGVPFRNLDQWRIFADLAEECPVGSSQIRRWLLARDVLPERMAGNCAATNSPAVN
jgi:nucleoside-triphosphatase THEP1